MGSQRLCLSVAVFGGFQASLSHATSHASPHLVKIFGKNGAVLWTLGADDHSLRIEPTAPVESPNCSGKSVPRPGRQIGPAFRSRGVAGSLVLMSICPQIAFTIRADARSSSGGAPVKHSIFDEDPRKCQMDRECERALPECRRVPARVSPREKGG